MSHTNAGNILIQALRAIIVSCLKIVAILIGWVFKGTGLVLHTIGEFTLKLAAK